MDILSRRKEVKLEKSAIKLRSTWNIASLRRAQSHLMAINKKILLELGTGYN